MADGTVVAAELRAIDKRFGATHALRQVSLAITAGRVHALVRENGAGKSTLGNVLTGAITPDSGELVVAGDVQRLRSPRHAAALGIVGITQELSLIPARSVLDNVLLGTEPTRGGILDRRAQRARYAELERRYGLGVDPDAIVRDLSVADQQKVELLRALNRDADVLVMDEPTARLTTHEAAALLDIVRALSDAGTAIVYVSHFLEEVLAVADDVTIMRDGQVVRSRPAGDETADSLLEGMVGRTIGSTFPPKMLAADGAPVRLDVRGLTRTGEFGPVSLQVRAGDIVGIAGLVGAGRSELAFGIAGASMPTAGTVTIDGEPLPPGRIAEAIERGLYLIPESRREQGLVPRRSIAENVVLPHLRRLAPFGFTRPREERQVASRVCEQSMVRMAGASSTVASLSGGNQQKVMFARWLVEPPRVLIADEPTRGVDVAAKQNIYRVITELAAGGAAVVVISSELEELIGLAHRVLVMRGGVITAELEGDEIAEDRIIAAAFADQGAACSA
jgi:ABC-type sugar transport system ATPase subunit